MSIEMSNPWWLLLIPVIIAGVIISGRFIRISNKQKKVEYMVMRGIIAGLLVLTLCGLSVKLTTKQITTIFLVDMSDSNKENLTDIETYIRTSIEDMPKKNQVGVVVFGEDVLVDQFVTEKKTFAELTTQPVSTATNLEKAVSSALTIFPDDTAKRLVLITDGLENAGNIEKMAGAVTSQNVDVKVIQLEQSMGEEVYVSNLELPDTVHIGDTFNIKVSIESNVTTQAVVSLYSGRNLKGQSTVSLTNGLNQFVFQDTAGSNGTQDYRVMVEPVNDTVSMNNEYCAFTQVESEPKVLLIEGNPGEGEELAKILDSCGVNYDKITPTAAPVEMSKLIEYKAVIMVNVNSLNLHQGFLDILESYVRDYAGGLICTGGDQSFAMGGYQDTSLETVLPVNMYMQGEQEVPSMAIAMVIDHSGSMTTPVGGDSSATCLDLAKQAALEGVKTLRGTDEVGVLVFDDTYDWAVPMQNASNTEAINNGIATIGFGGGTSIFPALAEATNQLSQSDAQIKHIILLTDGQDYYDQYDEVLDKINNAGITLSTVAVGADSDQRLLERLANQCGGRYYYTDVGTGIPKIFTQEIILSGKSYVVNREFTPVITSQSELIDGLTDNGVPTLLGYVGASPKSRATVIFQSDEGDPILTTWQYGLGRTIAWNTDASNKWTANWANWENYVQLWDNMINYVVSNTNLDGDSLEIAQEGSSAVITYHTEQYDTDTTVKAVCTDADGNTREIELDPVAPGEYQANMEMEDIGIYTISLQNRKGEEVQSSMITAAAMQYSPEYRFDLVTDGLTSFVSQVNGSYITYEDSVFADKLEAVKARTNLSIPLLIAALILFLFDVASRRMNLEYREWIQMLIKNRKRKSASQAKKEKQAKADKKSATGKRVSGKQKSVNGQTASGEQKSMNSQTAAGEQKPMNSQTAAGGQKAMNSQSASEEAKDKKAKKQEKQKTRKQKSKKEKQQPIQEESLDMDELLRKKEERNW